MKGYATGSVVRRQVHQTNLVAATIALHGVDASERYRDAHVNRGSESFGVLQRMVLEMHDRGILDWLENPQVKYEIAAQAGKMNINITLTKDDVTERFELNNRSNVTIDRAGTLIQLDWNAILEAPGAPPVAPGP